MLGTINQWIIISNQMIHNSPSKVVNHRRQLGEHSRKPPPPYHPEPSLHGFNFVLQEYLKCERDSKGSTTNLKCERDSKDSTTNFKMNTEPNKVGVVSGYAH